MSHWDGLLPSACRFSSRLVPSHINVRHRPVGLKYGAPINSRRQPKAGSVVRPTTAAPPAFAVRLDHYWAESGLSVVRHSGRDKQ